MRKIAFIKVGRGGNAVNLLIEQGKRATKKDSQALLNERKKNFLLDSTPRLGSRRGGQEEYPITTSRN